MSQKYFYAVGTIIKTLGTEGDVTEECVFLGADEYFIEGGLPEAVVYSDESQALKIAHRAHGRVVRVHHEYVEQLDIEVKD